MITDITIKVKHFDRSRDLYTSRGTIGLPHPIIGIRYSFTIGVPWASMPEDIQGNRTALQPIIYIRSEIAYLLLEFLDTPNCTFSSNWYFPSKIRNVSPYVTRLQAFALDGEYHKPTLSFAMRLTAMGCYDQFEHAIMLGASSIMNAEAIHNIPTEFACLLRDRNITNIRGYEG